MSEKLGCLHQIEGTIGNSNFHKEAEARGTLLIYFLRTPPPPLTKVANLNLCGLSGNNVCNENECVNQDDFR